MEDGADNGMIIYIILTERITAAASSIEKFNYISLHFTTTKRRTEIFPDSLLGKNRFCYEEFPKIFEGHFHSSVCNLGEIDSASQYGFSVILLVNLKALII